MTVKHLALAAIVSLLAAPVSAAVISGPTLDTPGGGWVYTGVQFHANQAATLTGFVFQNQGQLDTILLTDLGGNILYSVASDGSPSQAFAVSWALAAGGDYRLLQSVESNEYYATYGAALPSNADITITKSGIFEYDVAASEGNFGPNDYWAAFNDITTVSGTVPEPASWALMLIGFGLAGAALRRQRTFAAA